jgi:hypothetical protein
MAINPIIIQNCSYNSKIVKEIYFYKLYKPNKHKYDVKIKRDLVWQYYRNRYNKSVNSILENVNENIVQILISYIDHSQEFIQKN